MPKYPFFIYYPARYYLVHLKLKSLLSEFLLTQQHLIQDLKSGALEF